MPEWLSHPPLPSAVLVLRSPMTDDDDTVAACPSTHTRTGSLYTLYVSICLANMHKPLTHTPVLCSPMTPQWPFASSAFTSSTMAGTYSRQDSNIGGAAL